MRMMLQEVVGPSGVVVWDYWWLEMVSQLMELLQEVIEPSGVIAWML